MPGVSGAAAPVSLLGGDDQGLVSPTLCYQLPRLVLSRREAIETIDTPGDITCLPRRDSHDARYAQMISPSNRLAARWANRVNQNQAGSRNSLLCRQPRGRLQSADPPTKLTLGKTLPIVKITGQTKGSV